jgi:dihydroorotase
MTQILIKDSTIINENQQYKGSVLIENEIIKAILRADSHSYPEHIASIETMANRVIDAKGLYLIPGMIDDQVHFRDPGLTHKGDLYTESRAAVAGGITSFMEMPNTNPRTVTKELLDEKFAMAKEKSWANYSFYMGTTNDNYEEVSKINPQEVCGIKIFLGASTGDMLVDNEEAIEKILSFSAQTGLIVAVHSEKEEIIRANTAKYRQSFGDEIDLAYHADIRSREACVECSKWIIGLAKKHQANLHILHLSTADEIDLLDNRPIEDKHISAEVCIHHLWFTKDDHKTKGAFIKWNPAIKEDSDRQALRKALKEGYIDILATDHAPHTLEEKSSTNYFKCPSGGPLVQHVLIAALELYHQGVFTLEEVVEKSSHNIAKRFKVDRRGFIKEGYYADLTLVDLNSPWKVDKSNILYKCAWSPFEDIEFKSRVTHTIINGEIVYDNGKFSENHNSQKLTFNR